MDEKLDRVVVLTDRAGKQYVGHLPETVPSQGNSGSINAAVTPEEYMSLHAGPLAAPVVLRGARALVANREVKLEQGPDGQPEYGGMTSFIIMVPIEMAGGPLEKLCVHPVSWYFPKDNKKQAATVIDLFKKAEENEKLTAAAETLAVPGINA